MRALVTGITGFAGGHLCEHLLNGVPGAEVFGIVRGRPAVATGLPAGARLLEADLLDPASLLRAIEAARPDVVFHLGASSSVASSWAGPQEIMQVNVLGTLHLLESLREARSRARVVLACSAEGYGRVPEARLPVTEDEPLRPLSPYGVSKAAVDIMGFQQHAAYGMDIVRLRLFNHCGPGQRDRFVVAGLARQVAEAASGLRPPRVLAGALDARRDFVDVRDVARAYVAAAERGRGGAVYNVATGAPHSVREVAETLIALSGVALEVGVDPDRLRQSDIAVLSGDGRRFGVECAWTPTFSFSATLADTLAHWRAQLES